MKPEESYYISNLSDNSLLVAFKIYALDLIMFYRPTYQVFPSFHLEGN
jgi:hypothetical protein